jgi:hypothetical protein
MDGPSRVMAPCFEEDPDHNRLITGTPGRRLPVSRITLNEHQADWQSYNIQCPLMAGGATYRVRRAADITRAPVLPLIPSMEPLVFLQGATNIHSTKPIAHRRHHLISSAQQAHHALFSSSHLQNTYPSRPITKSNQYHSKLTLPPLHLAVALLLNSPSHQILHHCSQAMLLVPLQARSLQPLHPRTSAAPPLAFSPSPSPSTNLSASNALLRRFIESHVHSAHSLPPPPSHFAPVPRPFNLLHLPNDLFCL